MIHVFDVTEYGAVGDGTTDSTAAIQQAIDAAAKVKGAVVVPPGRYLCGCLKLYPSVCLEGYHGWGYRETGGSVLILNDPKAKCLLDITGAFGACIKGLQFNGNELAGESVHGIYLESGKYNGGTFAKGEEDKNPLLEPTHAKFREDNFVITDCQCKNFSGDGIHLSHIFAFTVSDCQLMSNGGDGIYINGWDGWIHDCIIHTNSGAGIGSAKENEQSTSACSSVTITGNRIEWNRDGGIHLNGGDSLNINNNFFDRSGGPSVKFENRYDCVTVVGNIFRRSGKKNFGEFADAYDNSHVYIKNAGCTTITGNVFKVGIDDCGVGELSPDYCIVYHKDCNLQIACNAYDKGYLVQDVVVLPQK